MSDGLKAKMPLKTNEELIAIVTVDAHLYQADALAAAKEEIAKRNIDTREWTETEQTLSFERIAGDKAEIISAGSGVRLLHAIVDLIVFGFLLSFMFAMFAFFTGSDMADDDPLLVLFELLAFLAVFAVPEYFFQKTPGKFLTKTKVVMARDGSKPGLGRVLGRNFGRIIPFDCWTFLFGKTGIHDAVSGTTVIMDRKPAYSQI